MRPFLGWLMVGGLVLAQTTTARAQGALNATGAYPGGAYGSRMFQPYAYGNAFTKSPTYRPHFYSPSYRSQYVAPPRTYVQPYAPYGGARSTSAPAYPAPYRGYYPTTSRYAPYGFGSYSYGGR